MNENQILTKVIIKETQESEFYWWKWVSEIKIPIKERKNQLLIYV
jgi:hypothetical protein